MPAPKLNHNPLDIALGLRIRQRRTMLRVSQTALAQSVGLTFQQIQKYERGVNRISFSRLAAIARALDCGVVDLVGDIDDGALDRPLNGQDFNHIREIGAPELLRAYSTIPPALQRAILSLLKSIAKTASGLPTLSKTKAPPTPDL